ncbi:MAG: RagB/SusD family nutrient uptake outer membrane protein [Flavisolibacter sp.]
MTLKCIIFKNFLAGKVIPLSMLILLLMMFSSCKKFVEIPPPKTKIVTASVFNNDVTTLAALNGIYSQMMTSSGFASGGIASISNLCGLSSDEFNNFSTSPEQISFYTNSLQASNGTLRNYLWGEAYNYIYQANAVIEGLQGSNGITPSLQNQFLGEAKFIRAFCNFYLVNLFGNIPLVLTTSYAENAKMQRTSSQQVYQQIVSDLRDATSLLPNDYSSFGGKRIRPVKWAAKALLSRVYLYQDQWDLAESEANDVINQTSLYSLPANINSVFQANSPEAIWQLLPVIPGQNTNEAFSFLLTSSPGNVTLSTVLINSFESGDLRKSNWIGNYTAGGQTYFFPCKYKVKSSNVVSEYSMVLRLAEQYLIRAEARARQNNIMGAQADLNAIRNRSGLGNTMANDQVSLLNAILNERQDEFFSEWGHRWLDLKRTGNAPTVLSALKSPNWQSTDTLYPIPQTEINSDPALTQNPGY